MDILEKIKELMRKEDVTAYRMTKDFGLTHGYISNFLKGPGNPKWKTIVKIMDYLGYEIRFVKKKETKNGNDL